MVNRTDRYREYTDELFEYLYPFTWQERSFNYLEILPDRDWKETQDWMFPPACRNCLNHPRNGGSGICHCILDSPEVMC